MATREYYFAIDMMRYVAKKYKIDWDPPVPEYPLTPLTFIIVAGIDAFLKEWDNSPTSKRVNIRGSASKIDFNSFIERKLKPPRVKVEKHPFVMCALVARYATLFYLRGAHQAPDAAIELIESTLHRAAEGNPLDIFQRLELHCLNVLPSARNG